ncbi:FecR family protein [Echinicola sp. 20G]|uniref:FecR family protein n=1 Tax=Echinicola sp. 20G TaxID=2781961 RepID=UPI00190FE4DB|nr:FecR domain-containing protein [Echinicola sp. 20G]
MGRNYHNIEDFLEDKTFCDWVLNHLSTHRLTWELFESEHPELELEIKAAKEILLELYKEKRLWEKAGKDRVGNEIKERLGFNKVETRAFREKVYQPQSVSSNLSWGIAAVIALVLTCAGIVGWYGLDQKETITVPSVAMVVKSNQKGQKSIVHLPDGSQVTLNSSSEISYLSNFGKDHRNLTLEGEAFFQVTRDTSMAFTVTSGEITTTALGTSFNINAYEKDRPSVKLATGVVEVTKARDKSDLMRLTPGEEAFLGVDLKVQKREFDLESAFLWKEGIIFFDESPFSEVVLTLERWYGVEITLKELPTGKLPLVSGRFENDHLDNVLESIGYSLRFSHEITQKNVTVSFNKPKK